MTKARHTGFAHLTQKEVSQAVARHEMLYSGRVGGARASFAFCDLSGLDLAGRNLADADFTGAVMEECNLEATRLAGFVVLGSNEAFVTEAIGNGKKALDNPDLKMWIGLADQKAPIWAAGRVDPRVKTGLVRVTNGQLTAGPAAMVVAVDPTDGATLEVGALMASPADAKALESFAKNQLALLGMAAQAKSLGTIIDKIAIAADGTMVRFKAILDLDEVNQLVSALDVGGGSAQGSPPAAGSGSGSSR